MPEKKKEKGMVLSGHISAQKYVFTFIFNLSVVEHPANSQDQYYIKVYLVFILYLHKHDSEKCQRNFTYQIHSCTLAFLQIQRNFEQCLTFFQKLSPTEGPDSCCSCGCSGWSMAWMVAEQEQEHPQCPAAASSHQFHSDTVTSGSGREGADRAAPPPSGHFYTPTSRWRLPASCILHSLLIKLQTRRQAF